jgi:hypothetical protein
MEALNSIIDTISYAKTALLIKDTSNVHNIISDQIQTSSASDIVSSVSAAIAALAAMIAIIITYISSKQERESKRPYFTILEPGFQVMSTNYRIQITFMNIGSHPAQNFHLKIQILSADFKDDQPQVNLHLVNDIPTNTPTPYYSDNIVLNPNMKEHFIICRWSYSDPILKKEFYQEYYMKWNGSLNENWILSFNHASTEEKNSIDDYLLKKEAK